MTIAFDPAKPEEHPLFARQVALEHDMMTTGADELMARVNKSIAKGQASELAPFRKLMTQFVEPFATAIQEWKGQYEGKRGRRPIALTALATIPNDTLAFLTLRCIFDKMGNGAAKVTDTSHHIGAAAEQEARVVAWKRYDQELWDSLKKELQDQRDEEDGGKVRQAEVKAAIRETGHVRFEELQQRITDQKSTSDHRRRVNINRFNKLVKEEIEWTPWANDLKQHVGLALIDLAIRATKRFSIGSDPTWDPRAARKGYARPLVLFADAELTKWIREQMEREQLFNPFFMPTIMPPKPWTDLRHGGYWTDLVPQRIMIRFKADHEEQRRRAVADMSNVAMPDVYAALNAVQGVPWKVNSKVLAVLEEAWRLQLPIAGLPSQLEKPIPPRPEAADLDPQVERDWKRLATTIHGENARLAGKVQKAQSILKIATKFNLEERFYFPHVLDFRGRMYPIPNNLNPQGEDLARGLLTFADGKPLTEEGAEWLAIQVCNTSGNDKVPFEERVEWTLERETKWRNVVADPFIHRDWTKADEPWQHLAAIYEWVRFLDEGLGMVSSLPVRVDGTCNGIQHLSAMIRDEVGGASVNLVPGNRPRDIYKEIADQVLIELQAIADQDEADLINEQEVNRHDHAVYWLNALNNVVPRSLTKRPVMILPYGGSRDAYFKYTVKWMEENDPDKTLFPDERRGRLARFMTNVLWEIVGAVLVRAKSVQEWLQKVARIAAVTGMPLRWETPIGFMVRHFYGKRREVRIETKIDGRKIKLRNWEMTAELDIQDQLQGIAPNFTHGMDATALMESILLALDHGVTALTTIHDAYGTVASDVPILNACLRRAFVTIYEDFDILGDYWKAVEYDLRAAGFDPVMPERPLPGNLNISQVIDSTYFFA